MGDHVVQLPGDLRPFFYGDPLPFALLHCEQAGVTFLLRPGPLSLGVTENQGKGDRHEHDQPHCVVSGPDR